MDETAPDPLQLLTSASAGVEPALTVAYHPDPAHLGSRRLVDERLVLGRGSSVLGPGILDDDLLSRNHAEVSRKASVVTVRDLGSRNGTFVNGERIAQSTLKSGDVLAVGSVMLVLGWGPRSFPAPRDDLFEGVSAVLQHLLDEIRTAAPEETTVLLRGETGVGKELVARRIHELSGRRGPFVAINCGGMPDGVLASELFGHVAGAFSGAQSDRTGLVQAAAGGTLLLDEIGDASAQLQVSLLRLLQNREYRPVGSSQPKLASARFIAATHVRLDPAVAAGCFREDLLGRLRRWVIDVAPLRERREDILPIALRVARERLGPAARIDRSLAMALLSCNWPDNVRGLRAVVESAAIDAQDGVATLTPRVRAHLDERTQAAPDVEDASQVAKYRKERPDGDYLLRRFVELDSNVKALAAELGVARNTLYRWFREAGIDPKTLRSP
jgi:transcriptional regulator with PAS, ATPase and Fis domain